MNILSIENITKKVKGNVLLDNISFSIKEGEIVSLIGPNGAGKSTIMKVVSHLVFPDEGKIFVCGNEITKNTTEALSSISTMIESPALYPQFTGKQHLEMTAYLRNKSQSHVQKYIDFCNLGANINQRITKYSLGMKQRLYLSMALMVEPKLLILDEPTNGLDFTGVLAFFEKIKAMSKKGTAILLSSHILSDLSKISNKFVFMEEGKILHIVANNEKVDVERLYRNSYWENEKRSGHLT